MKQFEGIEQGEKQFRMKVATISSTHHLNLVRLIGFYSEGHHRLLVYELMKNESLDNFLFTTEQQSGKFLKWALEGIMGISVFIFDDINRVSREMSSSSEPIEEYRVFVKSTKDSWMTIWSWTCEIFLWI
ncbi:G-type lectin S-receptor-like serine/threonine-protein kinase At1g34300 [Camellia sinensis]|uniref:G-type lectin S-receptor-like serine/threonine-protein kinase At1g34300 n=1 Tax=Camellia sinensis TaxID=4442 RepID=UPI001035C407|nr:G-type lectin S-receptor-like serine/threonine-protein kinase At1g34300 [Camellia sinensis]